MAASAQAGPIGRLATQQPSAASLSGSRFVQVFPCRLVDTRNAAGPFGGPRLTANSTRTFTLPSAACGLPATSQAYSLNITVVPSGPLQYLTIWPAGQTQPFVSTLNSFDGRIVANAAIVPAGTGGAVSVFVTNDTDVVIDVNGYFDAQDPAAAPFFTLTPCRVADTRTAAGPLGGPALAANVPRSFPLPTGACNVPATAVNAYSLNATVVPAGPLGFLTLWPTGTTQPLASTLNSVDGRIVANAALVPAGTSGSVSAFATTATDLILDINGYFGPTGTGTPLSFFPLTPCRLADTRNAAAPFGGPSLGAAGSRTFAVPQGSCGAPANAKAYAMNVTVVPQGPLQFLTIWPSDQPRPTVSTLNSFQGSVVANAAIVPAAADGSVSVFVSDAADVILDVNGYFAPATTTPQPDFTLAVTPPTASVTQGATATYTVTLTGQNGFTGAVQLALTNTPGNQNLPGTGFTSNTLNVPANGSASTTLMVATDAATPIGAAVMTVSASNATVANKTQNITLNVSAATAQGTQVTINNFQFSPTPAMLAAGSQVTWTNVQTGVPHRIVADGGQFSSGVLSTGQTFTTMPATPGNYPYHCGIHPFMTGTLVVQ